MMEKFFYLHFKEDDGGSVLHSSLDAGFQICDETSGTPVFRLGSGATELQDYQANDKGIPLMSKKLRECIDSVAPVSGIRWVSVCVEAAGSLAYFAPCFDLFRDVLDESASKFIDGPMGRVVMKAVLSAKKTNGIDFFPIPGSNMRLVVSGRLRKEIKNLRPSGIEFFEVPLTRD